MSGGCRAGGVRCGGAMSGGRKGGEREVNVEVAVLTRTFLIKSPGRCKATSLQDS